MVMIQRESRIDDEGDTGDDQKCAVLGKLNGMGSERHAEGLC